jgi:hypothetical protein
MRLAVPAAATALLGLAAAAIKCGGTSVGWYEKADYYDELNWISKYPDTYMDLRANAATRLGRDTFRVCITNTATTARRFYYSDVIKFLQTVASTCCNHSNSWW